MTTVHTGPLADGVREFLLAAADDKHLMGQQHAEWIGVAPFLEEDLAFCSIGQDELGHAALIYELVVVADTPSGSDRAPRRDPEELDRAVDALAFGREAEDYRSAWLVERDTPEWDAAVVRHWLFDHADRLRWELLAGSSLAGLADVAARVEREEVYHRRHADAILDSLMTDPDAAERLRAAARHLAPLATGLFEPVSGEAEAISAGVASGRLAGREREWRAEVEARFGPIDWADGPDQGNRTRRSDSFAPLMARMREVFEIDPDARW